MPGFYSQPVYFGEYFMECAYTYETKKITERNQGGGYLDLQLGIVTLVDYTMELPISI